PSAREASVRGPGVYGTVVLPSSAASFGRPAVEPPRQGPLSSLLGTITKSADLAPRDSRGAALPSGAGALGARRAAASGRGGSRRGAQRRHPSQPDARVGAASTR